MTYSNTGLCPDCPAPHFHSSETVLSLETDQRGRHLRMRETITRHAGRLAGVAALLLVASAAQATLSVHMPDAWVRDNSSTTAYFGWDVMESSGITLGFGTVLDDTTPDVGTSLGIGVTGLNGRIFQGTGVSGGYGTYGHRSGSSNYYSGFNETDYMDDSITATSRGTSGGFTTVVLQVLGSAANTIPNLTFAISGATFTLQKSLYGVASDGTGQYWYEWSAPGANLSFTIDLNSPVSSIGVDSFTVDTYWTNGAGPVLNSLVAVPEPSAVALLGAIGVVCLARRKR